MRTLSDLIATYGEALVTRWSNSGADKYDKRASKPKRVSDVALNKAIAKLSPEQLEELKKTSMK